ncbi:MAG TPA: Gfo/Idh/MocA family oxidoreductase [Steroidobacteraceae bacterium]|nr:Gfo/Idh/MocA family oxidoreductase [Steroidobacteraceae bacterium]
MNIGIIGCGAVGQKRAQHLAGARLVHCADIDLGRATLAASSSVGCTSGAEWREVLDRAQVDAIIIATPQDLQAEIARAAISAGIHVLVEKPAARHADELRELPQLAARHNVRVRVGFNHRYHRAFQQARRLVDSGALGPLLFLRARYGHGGRPGYASEWRADPQRSGGGELIDQGVHLIDLARWFLGEFVEVDGFAHTYFWDMPVEDNGFMLLKTATRQVAFLHASSTEWKNTFSWELYGRDGKLQVDGLGGSYGVEKLSWHKMLPEMGPPETMIWEYPMADNSWSTEMAEFLEDIRRGRDPAAGLQDAIAALAVVAKIYERSGYDHRA